MNDNEPGNRSGEGADSLLQHIDNDARRTTLPQRARGLDRSKHTILVVDHSPAARYAVARGLRAAGFRTTEASAGGECFALATTASGLVLDVQLPDIGGLEVCRLLRGRADTATLPIVHVSAVFVDARYQAESGRAGANAFLVAPVSATELAALMDTLIANRPESLA